MPNFERQPILDEFHPEWGDWDTGHPYAWRTWLRVRLPMVLIELGLGAKGENCARLNVWHRWYTQDDDTMACYHCEQTRPNIQQGHIFDAAQALNEESIKEIKK